MPAKVDIQRGSNSVGRVIPRGGIRRVIANVFALFVNIYCGSNSVGRVTAFQAVGRGFESRLPLSNGHLRVGEVLGRVAGLPV